MSSLFIGKSGLRHQYRALTAADLAAASAVSSAVQLLRLDQASRMLFLDSTLNQDAELALVHPEADSSITASRLFWIELPSNRVINYDISQAGLVFDPGTVIMVWCPIAPATGKVRIAAWG